VERLTKNWTSLPRNGPASLACRWRRACTGMLHEFAGAHDFGVLVLVIFMACVAKFLPTLIVSKIVTKQSWRFCASLGVLMNTRGLVELIVLNIGLDNGIFSIKL
jgi:Kef-type K+ transport system membrane component KefB